MPAFDIADAVRLGGWDPRCAVALAAGSAGDVAVAMVDTNGDGHIIECDTYTWEDGAWQGAGSSGCSAPTSFWTHGAWVSFGRARPGERIDLMHDGHHLHATTSEQGYWLIVTPAHAAA